MHPCVHTHMHMHVRTRDTPTWVLLTLAHHVRVCCCMFAHCCWPVLLVVCDPGYLFV